MTGEVIKNKSDNAIQNKLSKIQQETNELKVQLKIVRVTLEKLERKVNGSN